MINKVKIDWFIILVYQVQLKILKKWFQIQIHIKFLISKLELKCKWVKIIQDFNKFLLVKIQEIILIKKSMI